MRTRLSKEKPPRKRSTVKQGAKRFLCAEPIKSWPVKERPREWLLANGPARLSDAELLAVILRVGSGSFKGGVSGKSAYDLALSLLKEFRGLGGIDRAHSEELLKAPGLGTAKVAQIKATFELGKRLCAGRLTAPGFASSTAVAGHFRPLFTGRRQDCVCALFLGSKGLN
jgi:DNA repair protein RadC